MQNTITRVSVIGLGKLGVPMAACFAAKGFETIGVDTNPQNIEAIQNGSAPVTETGLQELLESTAGKLRATQDVEKAIVESEITFIVVPTPSEPDGGFSLRYVLSACDAIGQVLHSKQAFHLVVLTSTVMPGATDGPVRQTLEQSSGKQCGQDFGLCYSPEFIALGSVIHDFLNPDFFLVGESDLRSGSMLEAFYRKVAENTAPVARMNFINAELAKLSVNTYVTTKITFANMLTHICEQLPEGDVDVVTAALGLDSRIGRKYLKGATGYGGPCFPRDNLALIALARQLGISAPLAETTDRSNREEIRRLVELVKTNLPNGGAVGILGLSYKPKTGIVEESQGVLLAQALLDEHISVVVYDPAAMENARQALNGSVHFAESLQTCVEQADVIVITTPWEEFCHIKPSLVERQEKPRVIVDCWRILPQDQFKSVARYVALGVGPQKENI